MKSAIVNMDTFASSFDTLVSLFNDADKQPNVEPGTVSRASDAARAAIGPQGIFPGVKIAEPKVHADPNEIWSAEEVTDGIDDDIEDEREAPDYEFIYKQAVQTSDNYLGLDPMGKDPSSSSCEDLVLRVTLPDAQSAADIDVDLKAASVVVRTGKFKLSTYLPHTVDEKKSRAQWDRAKSLLSLTMRIVREDW